MLQNNKISVNLSSVFYMLSQNTFNKWNRTKIIFEFYSNDESTQQLLSVLLCKIKITKTVLHQKPMIYYCRNI